MVARQVFNIIRISPLGRRKVTYLPSDARICAEVPAERANCAPLPGRISILCTTVPKRDIFQRAAIPRAQRAHSAIADRVADLNPHRRNDIALHAVFVLQQARCAPSDWGRIRSR